MFWADRFVESLKKEFKEKIKSNRSLIIRDEKTASGRVHVGSLRGVVIHGVISEILSDENITNKYFYEINDFDPMDGLPTYLDQEKFSSFMGKPLCEIPSPDGKALNFAEYFGQEFIGVIEELGFKPEYTRSSVLYKEGKYNDYIKLAMDNAQNIRDIYKEISGSQKGSDWFPINIRCENCGNISTTQVLSWDGEIVEYKCENIEWAKGCSHLGKISPYNGKAKLPWKVEWAAKFKIYNVDIEGAGKDHSTRGGARQVAEAISRKVFKHEPPFDVPYEFFLVGGRKMSSSKGKGSSAREMANLLPPHILRFLLISKDITQQINVDPEEDSIPMLFDAYDRIAKVYWQTQKNQKLFKLVHVPYKEGLEKRALPRFSTVAYLVQMPHVDILAELEKLDGFKYEEKDKKELELRSKYARIWLSTYAPEDYKFEIQKEIPEVAKNFSQSQKNALKKVLEYIQLHNVLDGQELHTNLHEIRKTSELEPNEFFKTIYLSILGKKNGPKAGWFLSVLDRNFLIKRFKETVG